MLKVLCLGMAAAFLSAGCSTKATLPVAEDKAEQLEFTVSMPYRSFAVNAALPGDYSLIVFLHGAGERGNDNQAQMIHGVKNILAYAEKNQKKCIVLAPQCPTACMWSVWGGELTVFGEAVKILIDQYCQKYNIDSNRIYLTGLSMGGYGTWSLAKTYPEIFAAAIPICGGGDPVWAEQLKNLPLLVYHGALDEVVSVENSRKMVEALQSVNGNVKYIEYPEENHGSWIPAYADDTTFDWLFSQVKAQK